MKINIFQRTCLIAFLSFNLSCSTIFESRKPASSTNFKEMNLDQRTDFIFDLRRDIANSKLNQEVKAHLDTLLNQVNSDYVLRVISTLVRKNLFPKILLSDLANQNKVLINTIINIDWGDEISNNVLRLVSNPDFEQLTMSQRISIISGVEDLSLSQKFEPQSVLYEYRSYRISILNDSKKQNINTEFFISMYKNVTTHEQEKLIDLYIEDFRKGKLTSFNKEFFLKYFYDKNLRALLVFSRYIVYQDNLQSFPYQAMDLTLELQSAPNQPLGGWLSIDLSSNLIKNIEIPDQFLNITQKIHDLAKKHPDIPLEYWKDLTMHSTDLDRNLNTYLEVIDVEKSLSPNDFAFYLELKKVTALDKESILEIIQSLTSDKGRRYLLYNNRLNYNTNEVFKLVEKAIHINSTSDKYLIDLFTFYNIHPNTISRWLEISLSEDSKNIVISSFLNGLAFTKLNRNIPIKENIQKILYNIEQIEDQQMKALFKYYINYMVKDINIHGTDSIYLHSLNDEMVKLFFNPKNKVKVTAILNLIGNDINKPNIFDIIINSKSSIPFDERLLLELTAEGLDIEQAYKDVMAGYIRYHFHDQYMEDLKLTQYNQWVKSGFILENSKNHEELFSASFLRSNFGEKQFKALKDNDYNSLDSLMSKRPYRFLASYLDNRTSDSIFASNPNVLQLLKKLIKYGHTPTEAEFILNHLAKSEHSTFYIRHFMQIDILFSKLENNEVSLLDIISPNTRFNEGEVINQSKYISYLLQRYARTYRDSKGVYFVQSQNLFKRLGQSCLTLVRSLF